MNDLVLRIDHIEVELLRLRRQNRWLRRVVAVLFLIGGFFLSANADPNDADKEARAQRVVIVDSGGAPRTVLAARTDKRQGLEIRDGRRKVLLALPEKE